MRRRYRFWQGLMVCALAPLLLSGCKPPAAINDRLPPPVVQSAIRLSPDSKPASAPQASITAPDSAAGTLNVVRVALLLPLTGRNAELGRALKDAASLSLFDKYARLSLRENTIRVELLPKDTGDTMQQAQQAMQAAMQDHVDFVIGPLFADATSAAAPTARLKNISVLSLSNTRTQASPGTYMFGFSPAEQADRVVSYAMDNGKSRIAVLVPNAALGEAVMAAARAAAERRGMKLAAEVTYSVQGAGIDRALNSLVTAGKPPTFDALLIAEGGATLSTLMRGLSARGVTPSNTKFLGTGLWDDLELLRRVNLDTAWLASSPPELTSQFDARFRQVYHYAPPRIASLTYDAVALAVTLATSGRAYDAVTLTSPAGFTGPANGLFRLRADGTVQRGLAVMQVEGGALRVIDPSPKGF